MAKRQTKRYEWTDKDFEVSEKVDLPENLTLVVEDAPIGDIELAEYLQNLLSEKKVTVDEVNFLIDSKVFENRS